MVLYKWRPIFYTGRNFIGALKVTKNKRLFQVYKIIFVPLKALLFLSFHKAHMMASGETSQAYVFSSFF